MSEESSKRNRRTRRIAARQNKPVLVTGGAEQDTTVATASTETEQEEIIPASETKVVQPRRGFLSVIGKRSESSEDQGIDATQARMARATRTRKGDQRSAAAAATEDKQEEAQPEKKPVRAAARAPQRPSSGFKLKYIIGMFLYLTVAELLGGYEVSFVRNSSIEGVLFTFTLFGAKQAIDTATIAYLATLIVLLVVLARFDLIPRSLTPASTSSARQTQGGTSSQDSEPAPKFTPPPVREGVKGESDDLYRQYRDRKLREKKK